MFLTEFEWRKSFCHCGKMCKVQMLRALVKQRLTAAAEEIFGLFERTIAEYEEELSRSKEENERQRKLLDAVFNPQLRLHRAGWFSLLLLSLFSLWFYTEQVGSLYFFSLCSLSGSTQSRLVLLTSSSLSVLSLVLHRAGWFSLLLLSLFSLWFYTEQVGSLYFFFSLCSLSGSTQSRLVLLTSSSLSFLSLVLSEQVGSLNNLNLLSSPSDLFSQHLNQNQKLVCRQVYQVYTRNLLWFVGANKQ